MWLPWDSRDAQDIANDDLKDDALIEAGLHEASGEQLVVDMQRVSRFGLGDHVMTTTAVRPCPGTS